MDDMISRKAAIDALAEQIMESALMDNPTTASTDIDRYRPIAELSLREVPSAQPEIIRCKDCRYAHLTRDGKCKYCDTWTDDDGYPLDLYVDGDFYCGNAERRTDEGSN